MHRAAYHPVRASAAFSINGRTLDNREITRRLARLPDYAHNRGDRMDQWSRYHDWNWGLRSGLPRYASLASHLRSLIARLDSRRDAIRSIHDTVPTRARLSRYLINDTDAGAD